VREQYTSYKECVDFFQFAQKKYPDLIQVEVIGKTWEERDIIAVSITKDVKNHKNKPALFYTGTIHAREWIGIELALAFTKHIIEHSEYDPTLTQILETTSLYIVPCANPDGFEYSRNHFSFWRKNRRRNPDGTFGVDLNRNFEVGYVKNNIMSSNVYSGPHPFSEPETQALRDFVLAHKNIAIALDYHSQGNVFFPAHNFKHEDAIDAIDLNLLAGNMAEEIRKSSTREYGIHMGKPPTHLISGSGREFYYSQGILSLVVEVGTRNISDYIENMSENISENIPALIYALSEVQNYSQSKLSRVEHFIATEIGAKEITLEWEYSEDEEYYFEIYRSSKAKGFAQASNRIAITKLHKFTDRNLASSTNFWYYIRAVSKDGMKSPFAQKLGVRTTPAESMFSKILYPIPSKIGYVGEKTKKNKEHFGKNSLFVGISQQKGECYGVIGYSLQTIPKNAIITSASISFYPMNRVAVQVESYGEWRVGQVDERTIEHIESFDDIKNAKVLSYIDRPTGSAQLAQGVWREYKFATQEIKVLQDALQRREALFRMEGPDSLPLDRASQLMQWDIGYGAFSGGLTFRPKLDISYTLEESRLDLQSEMQCIVNKEGIIKDSLKVGFNQEADKEYGYIEFNLDSLPDLENIVISSAYIELQADKIESNDSLRFHIEMIEKSQKDSLNYEFIKQRDVIERIGYDVSVADIKDNATQRFVFDRYGIDAMLQKKKVAFVISASSYKSLCHSKSVSWLDKKKINKPLLVLNYIKKHRTAPTKVHNLKYKIVDGMIKLEWDKPKDEYIKGVVVVKNRFRVPCSPYDGQKLYGGKDNYTFDKFGDTKIHKYYAVFSYDDVPNFSTPAVLEVNKSN